MGKCMNKQKLDKNFPYRIINQENKTEIKDEDTKIDKIIYKINNKIHYKIA